MARGRFALVLATFSYLLLASILVAFPLLKLAGIASLVPLVPLACVIAWAGTFAFLRTGTSTVRSEAIRAGLLLAVLLSTAWTARVFYDTSFDGRWYHQEGQIRLAAGFDPYRQSLPQDSLEDGIWDIRASGMAMASPSLWINHYPKAQEIVGAAMYSLTGDIETAKFQNFLLWIASGLLAFAVAARLFPASRSIPVVVGAVVASNPVVLGQLWSNYNDGLQYGYIVGLIGFLILHRLEGRGFWLVCAGLAALCLANVKFTGLVYAGALLALHGTWILLRSGIGSATRTTATTGSILLVGVFLVGYNPYVRNTLEEGHPLHPIMGPRAVDIMTINSSPDFRTKDRFRKFAEATFGRTAAGLPDPGPVPPKIPMTFSVSEFRDTASPDPRVAGFGPFAGTILVLSLLGWIASLLVRLGSPIGWRPRFPGPADLERFAPDLLVLAVLATTFVNPEAWWARYVPQLWLFPVIGWLLLRRDGNPATARAAWTIPVLQLATGVVVLGFAVFGAFRGSLVVERDFHRLETASAPELTVHLDVRVADRLKYRDHGIPVRFVAIPEQVEGRFRDTLMYGGILGYDDPSLDSLLHDPKRSGPDRELLSRFARSRLLP